MIANNISTLKIHKLTQEQYNRALESNNIDKNDLYYVSPDEILNSSQKYIDIVNDKIDENIESLSNVVSTNYDESIIGLSVDGQIITYIKGDGSVHSFTTQDTNTTYLLGTDEITGLTKLYATIGSAEDGTMTQKAIKTELDKKVGVTIDDSQDMLIFTI